MTTIDSFNGEHRFLSNFWPSPVVLDGVTYPTVEHAYAAAKSLDDRQRAEILEQPTPGLAKKVGRKISLRPDWEGVKLSIMECLVRQKFQDPELGALLLGTGDAELVEGNWWGDRFWGVCRGQGQNHLGKILMKIRSELPSSQGEAVEGQP